MSKSNALKLAVLLVILAATAHFAVRMRAPHPLEVGDSAPDFSVAAIPSGSVALGAYRQQVVVVNFWATWCPPCIEEAPSLERFAEAVRPDGVTVLGISVDEDPAALNDFISKYHLTYQIGRDPTRALPARYGTVQFPETYILDRHGRLAEKVIGAIDWDDPRILSFVRELARGPAHSGG